MLKLLFHDRPSWTRRTLLDHAGRGACQASSEASTDQLRSTSEFDSHSCALAPFGVSRRALLRRGAHREPHRGAGASTSPSATSVSPHLEIDGMPLQPIADTQGSSTIEVSRGTPSAASPISMDSATCGCSRTCTRRSAGAQRCEPSSTRCRTARSRHARRAGRTRSASRWRGSSPSSWSCGHGRGPRPAQRLARARPEAVRPPVRHADRGRAVRLVRGPRRACLRRTSDRRFALRSDRT